MSIARPVSHRPIDGKIDRFRLRMVDGRHLCDVAGYGEAHEIVLALNDRATMQAKVAALTAERDTLAARALRLESMGAVAAVADPLRAALAEARSDADRQRARAEAAANVLRTVRSVILPYCDRRDAAGVLAVRLWPRVNEPLKALENGGDARA